MSIVIKDLLLDKEIDCGVMASVRGGFKPYGFGGYGAGVDSNNQTQPLDPVPLPTSPFASDPLGIDNSPDQHQPIPFNPAPAKKHSYLY